MRLRSLGLGLCLLLATACQAQTPPALTDIHGHSIDTRGQWLVINYWASWCKPCREEIPELNRLSQELEGHPVRVLGFNFDQLEGPALQQASAELGIEFPVLTNASMQHIDVPGTMGLPVTFLVDPQGRFSERLLGEQTRASLVQALQQLEALPADF